MMRRVTTFVWWATIAIMLAWLVCALLSRAGWSVWVQYGVGLMMLWVLHLMGFRPWKAVSPEKPARIEPQLSFPPSRGFETPDAFGPDHTHSRAFLDNMAARNITVRGITSGVERDSLAGRVALAPTSLIERLDRDDVSQRARDLAVQVTPELLAMPIPTDARRILEDLAALAEPEA